MSIIPIKYECVRESICSQPTNHTGCLKPLDWSNGYVSPTPDQDSQLPANQQHESINQEKQVWECVHPSTGTLQLLKKQMHTI